MQTGESVMKKIILICFLSILFMKCGAVKIDKIYTESGEKVSRAVCDYSECDKCKKKIGKICKKRGYKVIHKYTNAGNMTCTYIFECK